MPDVFHEQQRALLVHPKITALYLKNPRASYTILVSHGNAADLGDYYYFLKMLQRRGYSVFSYDYQGYGTSTGYPSEKHVYADITAAYDYMVKKLKISPKRIVLYGDSLGAAVTLDLAARKPVAGLIVKSPFITAFRVVTVIPILPYDKFINRTKIKYVKAPILFIHGTRDKVIPIWHSKKLYKLANPPKYYYWVAKARHNDVIDIAGESYWKTIQEFINKLAKLK